LDSDVEFTGYAAVRAEYLGQLEQADLYVSTSPSDSTSVSLLEAMAAGLACVVPDIAGNREWIQDGVNGLLYPPLRAEALAAALERLGRDRALATRLGRRARETVQRSGRWNQTIRRAELLFTELVAHHPCRAS
jgi:glycosyltransferase involved in cell wall biosynthesis